MANRSHAYFHILKNYSPKLFEYMLEKGKGNIYDGYNKTRQETEQKTLEIEKCVFTLMHYRLVSFLAKALKEVGIYRNPKSFSTEYSKICWQRREKVTWAHVKKINMIHDFFMMIPTCKREQGEFDEFDQEYKPKEVFLEERANLIKEIENAIKKYKKASR